MRTQVKREYEYKIFAKGQLKQFITELAQFCGISPSDVSVCLRYKDGEFDTSKDATIDELENICEVGTPLESLNFHFESNIIFFSSNVFSSEFLKGLSVAHMIFSDIEYTKKLISFVENTLELKRLSEQDIEELIKEYRKVHDNSNEKKLYNSLFIGPTQVDTDHSIESNNPLVAVWHKAQTQLQLLCSAESYQTWIAPIFPSAENNQLILNCPNEYAKYWIESRYKKDIIETVQSIEPSVEVIIVRVVSKRTKQSDEATNEQSFIKIDEPLFEFMKQVYERDNEKTIGSTFEQYFTQVIQSHCQERLGHLISE